MKRNIIKDIKQVKINKTKDNDEAERNKRWKFISPYYENLHLESEPVTTKSNYPLD